MSYAEENTGQRNEDTGSSVGLQFVYVWMVLLLVGILVYGTMTLYKKATMRPLIFTLLFFANFCLLTLIMAGQGLISSEGRMFEDSIYGWYGQMGVLITYQAFWFLCYTVAFSFAFGILGCMDKGRQYDDKEDDEVEMSRGYSAPPSALA